MGSFHVKSGQGWCVGSRHLSMIVLQFLPLFCEAGEICDADAEAASHLLMEINAIAASAANSLERGTSFSD